MERERVREMGRDRGRELIEGEYDGEARGDEG